MNSKAFKYESWPNKLDKNLFLNKKCEKKEESNSLNNVKEHHLIMMLLMHLYIHKMFLQHRLKIFLYNCQNCSNFVKYLKK